MIAGSALLLLQHVAHMVWLLDTDMDLPGFLVAGGLFLCWVALFAGLLQRRPTFESERGEPIS
jgi:hypothetical protein